jgi:hypothetical protein
MFIPGRSDRSGYWELDEKGKWQPKELYKSKQ